MNHPDPLDFAADQTDKTNEAAIQAVLGNHPASVDPSKESANECIQCDALIPSARQVKVPGCQLCVPCAEALELLGKQGRR